MDLSELAQKEFRLWAVVNTALNFPFHCFMQLVNEPQEGVKLHRAVQYFTSPIIIFQSVFMLLAQNRFHMFILFMTFVHILVRLFHVMSLTFCLSQCDLFINIHFSTLEVLSYRMSRPSCFRSCFSIRKFRILFSTRRLPNLTNFSLFPTFPVGRCRYIILNQAITTVSFHVPFSSLYLSVCRWRHVI